MTRARLRAGFGLRLAAFARARDGATAVEFALVALPFLILLCAVFEACLMTFAQQTLNNAVDRAGRAVFTGAFQEGYDGTPAPDRFRAALCAGPTLFACEAVKLEVTTAKTFATSSAADPYDAGAKALSSTFGSRFQCPAGNDVVTIRAAVVVPRFFTILDLSPRKIGTSSQLIVATAVFRAEPYATGRC